MATLHEEIDLNSLHGWVVSNDGRQLEIFLQENPNTDINGLNEHGYTPLHLAADRGYVTLVEALLSKGADPSVKDSDDFTAAELARIAGHDEVGAILDKAMT
jgi:ankyrin repeat protein